MDTTFLDEAAAALGLPADCLPAPLRSQLLDLTRDIAHGVARVNGPLGMYLMGVAVGRGMAPGEAVEAVAALARPVGPTG